MQAPPKPAGETDRLRALHELHILDTVDEERFDRLTRIATHLFHVPIALVTLVDSERQWFKSRQGLDARETPRDTSFCAHTILQQEALVVRDALLDPRFHDNPAVVGEMGVRFYAGFPIRAPGGSNVGTLCIVDRKPRSFSDEDAVMLADLAAMVERELALLVQATQDPLTRLYNRRGLDEVATHVIALCDRSQHIATLVSIDLDGFKGINDKHGHEAGDQVLRWFAGQLLKHFRKSDVVARLGGDEFCVLAPQVPEEDMQSCLDRLATTFRASELYTQHPALSWSVGLVEFKCDGSAALEEVLQLADRRMYEAKARNRRTGAGENH
jgi:diguanylate cyclase (GGDEF)-like protein